jgi:hypothetical protein
VCRLTELLTGKKYPPTLREYDDWVRDQVGEVPRQEMTWQDMIGMLASHGLTSMVSDMPDYKIRFTDEATLAKMAPFLTYPADYYVAEFEINCDDYARWAAADARRIFQVQGIYEVWGWTPYGYHAWSLGITDFDKFRLFEPNAGFPFAGELFAAGENGFIPEKWK